MFVVPEWIEHHCVIPDGFRKGEPFRMYDCQYEFITAFYTVHGDAEWNPVNPVLAPAFLHRRALWIGPQKLGKNPLSAAHVCAEFVGPVLFAGWAGRDDGYACRDHGCGCGWEYAYALGAPMGMAWPTPKIQITAFSEDSTENTYDALRPMISQGPLAAVLPKAGEDFIRHPSGAEDSRIDTVTSSNQSRLGARSTFVPQDELGLWTHQNKMDKLADTQYRNLAGMGGRASLTSNAWDPSEHSVAQREYESAAKDVYRQFTQPPKGLSFGNKVERRKIYTFVYPPDTLRPNGGHVDLDSIDAEAADLITKDRPQAERFFANRIVTGVGAAIDVVVWDKLARPGKPPPAKTRIGIGFEGSTVWQATVLRGCTAEGRSFIIGVWERPEKAPVDWRIPRAQVQARVKWAFGHYDVGLMLCNPHKWDTEIEDWQDEYGEETVLKFDTKQERRMSPALDRWLVAIAEGTHTHDADPVTDAHVKAAHKVKVHINDSEDDGRTHYKLAKGGDRLPIDAAMADVLAYEAAMTMPGAVPLRIITVADLDMAFL